MSGLAYARGLAARVRFGGDIPLAPPPTAGLVDSELRGYFSQSDVLIGPSLTPGLHDSLEGACARLGIAKEAAPAFVYGSPEVQALCISRTGSDCVIRFSSGLVDLLDEDELAFVMGHEIGHFLLGHTVGVPETHLGSIEGQMLRRRQEISADRVGLVACHTLSTAVRALMKTASGLTSRHLRFDVGAFLAQLRHSDEGASSRWSTHPSVLVRCRALLWFSMSRTYEGGLSDDRPEELEKLDRRIEYDLERWTDGPDKLLIEEAETDVVLWTAAARIVATGTFSREEQARAEDLVGTEITDRLRTFLGALSRDEAESVVAVKLKQAQAHLEQLVPARFGRTASKLELQVSEAFR
ncbi:MAG: M48 family metallopeptidase [Gemmatimonadetes bacterium]|nr:M48 family metallopeptidase [Gemmatimonadota bacterium]